MSLAGQREPPSTPLLDFCLDVAREFDARIDATAVHAELDRLAAPWHDRELRVLSPRRQAEELAMIVFGLAGFAQGQAEEPADYLMDKVLFRRRGRPSLLGVIYQQVAVRLGVVTEPISAPDQYLWRVVDQHRPGGLDRAVIVDPARSGEILDVEEFLIAADEAWLQTMCDASWQRQLLEELRQLLVRRREFGGALLILHRQCLLEPNNPVVFRERGLLHRRLGAPLAAIEDLESYLVLAPHASDVQDMAETVDRLRDELHRRPGRWAN